MNMDERDQLNKLLRELVQARLTRPNAWAEGLIQEAFAAQPHAAYLLVERTLAAEQVIESIRTRHPELFLPNQRATGLLSDSVINPRLITNVALGVAAGAWLSDGVETLLEGDSGPAGLDGADLLE